jgi:hypothetical protein
VCRFVSTLLFFYWIFPSLLPRLQGMSTDTQRHWVGRHYFLQLFIAYFLMIFLSGAPSLAPEIHDQSRDERR